MPEGSRKRTRRGSRVARVVSIGALLSIVATSVEAQTEGARPERPFRPLFGDPRGATRSLVFSADLAVAYDDNVLADQGTGSTAPTSPLVTDPRYQQSGVYNALNTSLAYSHRARRVSLTAAGGSAFRYYPDLTGFTAIHHTASADVSGMLGSRTTVRASQQISLAPAYQLILFPAVTPAQGFGALETSFVDPVVTNPDLSVYARRGFISSSSAALSQELSSRSSVSAYYDLTRAEFSGRELDLRRRTAGVRFSRGLSRHASLRIGYAHMEGSYGFGGQDRLSGHNIDAGVDYNRALSFSRRTTLGFAVGSNAVSNGEQTRYDVTGHATLNHHIGRSWTAFAAYRRGMWFEDGFPEPIFSDSVTLGLGGYLSRRLEFRSQAGYSTGSVGFGSAGNGFDTYMGTARLQYGLTRYLATYVEYLYFHYEFSTATLLPGAFPRGLDRQGVRGGVSLWVPLYAGGRGERVTR